jgi:exopolysaccharide production protein ExoQ
VLYAISHDKALVLHFDRTTLFKVWFMSGIEEIRAPGRKRLRNSGPSSLPGSFGTLFDASSNSNPSVLISTGIIFALIIQQSAFIEMPALVGPIDGGISQDSNVYNTIGIAISVAIIGPLCVLNGSALSQLLRRNALSLAYIVLVLVSFTWSIHPDLTIRRAFGYLLSMAIAGYLAVGVNDIERMKLISASFAVSAIGSFLYVAAYPEDGIMHVITLEGTWRGVFTHKNVLGPLMAVAVFTEIYVLTATNGRPRWRFGLLAMYLALVALSRSATALLLSATYITTACVYLLWRRDRLLATVTALILLLASFLVTFVLSIDPEFALGLLGKDTGLTGRTELWEGVVRLIADRPILGYGYRAMWGPSDTYRILMDELTGGWGVTSSHNAFLEITLELGAVGMGLITLIVISAIWNSIQCFLQGNVVLGWFSFMYFTTILFAGQTWDTLGLNQNVFWLMFNVLFLSCGTATLPRQGKSSEVSGRARLARTGMPNGSYR